MLGSGVGARPGMDGRSAASLHAEAPLQDQQARRLLVGPFLRRAGKESLSTSAASQGQREPEATRAPVLSTWREPPAPPAPAQEDVRPRQGPSRQEERGVLVSPSVWPASNQPSSGSPVTGAMIPVFLKPLWAVVLKFARKRLRIPSEDGGGAWGWGVRRAGSGD